MRIIFMFLALFSLSSCAYFNDSAKTWSLTECSLEGKWQLELIDNNENTIEKHDVYVPGNWVLSGIHHAGEVHYSKEFNVSKKKPYSRYWLHFDAIDYESAVVLNGRFLNTHKGYFSPQMIEATNYIKSGDNSINVWVNSPNEKQSADWSLHKTTIKGVLAHHDTRPGGAWSDSGQDMNSGGIWGGVKVRETGPVAIKSIKIKPLLQNVTERLTSAEISVTLDSSYQGNVQLKLELAKIGISGTQGESEVYHVAPILRKGSQKINWVLPTLQRQLWWPWDWGEPALYQLKVTVLVNDKVSDSNINEVGFRKFNLNEKQGQFHVNGYPYFIRGTNYIASQWLGSVSEKDYNHDLKLMKQANINSIRIHAHVAGKDFYRLADKLGLIVWQDFPLQWGYSDSKQFITDAVSQTKDMTNMLFNHPSIAFWSGHNEPPWDADWMKYKYKSYSETQNQDLSEAVFKQLLNARDGRIVRKASYTYEHPWLGWYSGSYRDYKTYKPPVIVSEFGAQGFPRLGMVQKFLSESDHWPLSIKQVEKLKYHNYQPHETLNIAGVEQGGSLEQFIDNSQEYQRQLTKFAAENLRLKRDQGLAAIYQFMFVDSWPAVTWSVLDVERSPKPAFWALKQAYQPVLAIVEKDDGNYLSNLSIKVVNDSLNEYLGAAIEIKNQYDDKSWRINNVDILANSSTRAVLDFKMVGLSQFFLVKVFNSRGSMISENKYSYSDL